MRSASRTLKEMARRTLLQPCYGSAPVQPAIVELNSKK